MALHMPDPFLTVMYSAALRAEPALLRDFGEVDKLQISIKGPGDFVSRADRKAESDIQQVLGKSYPNIGFLMEESGKSGSQENCWIVDPLDGTLNFLHAIPHWCISIALKQNKHITHGLIHDPIRSETFFAVQGMGAFLNRLRIRCSARKILGQAVVAAAWQRPDSGDYAVSEAKRRVDLLQQKTTAVRITGSASLNFAYVAAGRLEGYYQQGLDPWDCAAGLVIVQEAGGMTSRPDGGEFDALQTQKPFLSSNTSLHNSLLKIIR
ncbi:MAG: inositol monophosphatase [Alphaproteobacteria bacterium]|nr:inositol monophosphatase [Alphaproteobacteria bacterium]